VLSVGRKGECLFTGYYCSLERKDLQELAA
jgi:hypothetical protein